MTGVTGTHAVEQHSIDYIPESERGGAPHSLFTLWFAGNMNVVTVLTGSLGVVLGLPLAWAIVAVVIGNGAGAVFMALHSAQGPRMGVPQMIQSRAQFGFIGAILPSLAVLFMLLGFIVTNIVVTGQALNGWSGISENLSVVAVAVAMGAIAVFGYRLIHGMQRIFTVLFIIAFVYLTVKLFVNYNVTGVFTKGHFSAGSFFTMVSIAASWQITYAPYVSDYSRYLPHDTSLRSTFLWTYGGAFLATSWMMIIGCIAAAVAPSGSANVVAFTVGLGGSGLSNAIYPIIILGIVAVNVLNVYSAQLTSITSAHAVRPRSSVGLTSRVVWAVIIVGGGALLAILAKTQFLTNYQNFLLLVEYTLIPWTAINLLDFYLIRKERYSVPALFSAHGIYGTVKPWAIVAYLVAVGAEIPFMNTTVYTGPVSKMLNGADVAWVVGLLVGGCIYYLAARRTDVEAELVRAGVAVETGASASVASQ